MVLKALSRLTFFIYTLMLLSCNGGGGSNQADSELSPNRVNNISVAAMGSEKKYMSTETFSENSFIQIRSARNEWESFQVLVRSSAKLSNVTLHMSDLVNSYGETINKDNYHLYQQHYIEVSKPSWNSIHPTGWYPDALIPFTHPLSREPLYHSGKATNLTDIAANNTQGFWIDLYTPSNTTAGTYTGTVDIYSNSSLIKSIEVSLTVWNFTLPSTPSIHTDFGAIFDNLYQYYQRRSLAGLDHIPEDWNAVVLQADELSSRHRITSFPDWKMVVPIEQPGGSYSINENEIDELRNYIDTYHVNSIRVPMDARWPAAVINHFFIDDEEKIAPYFAAWDEIIERLNRPQVVFYTYLFDEPNSQEDYTFINYWGGKIKETGTHVKVMITEQPEPENDGAWGDLFEAVDLWCVHLNHFDADSIAEKRSTGDTIWTYTALSGNIGIPRWHIDAPLFNYRINNWINWYYGINGTLYWNTTYWFDVDNPWADPLTWSQKSRDDYGNLIYDQHGTQIYDNYNGEGTLLYPARPFGFDGVVPSIRLKAYRDSVEDYEYLKILSEQAGRDIVNNLLEPIFTGWNNYSSHPNDYISAREQIGELINSQ